MVISTEYVSNDYLHLNSCGVEYLNKKDTNTLRQYGRKDYHILYIHSGVCYLELNSTPTEVKAGNIILFRPDTPQKYSFKKKDNSISCYIHFTGTACNKHLEEIFRDNKNIVYIGKSHTVKTIFEKMSKEYILKKNNYQTLCTAYMLEFFAVTGRKISYNAEKVMTKNQSDIDKICLLMHETYSENLPIKHYADCCNLSVSRFAHLFKDTVGVSPLEYIIRIRINKAKEYLSDTDFSLSEISELCGFCNQNYFSKTFKEKTGISPKFYVR